MHIGFTKQFDLLAQEAHLTKNAILSSFELLIRANFFQDKEGYFYSSFFHMTIGFERLMKLAVVSEYMLNNKYVAPTEKYLKTEYGHHINTLYEKVMLLEPQYMHTATGTENLRNTDRRLLDFLTKFGTKSRYHNLNEIGKETDEKSPLEEWYFLAEDIYREETKSHVIERAATGLMHQMDKEGYRNGFTSLLSFAGHPMSEFDVFYRQLVIEKSSRLIVYRLIALFRPIHHILTGIGSRAAEYEVENERRQMVIPHYEDFFYFFNAIKPTVMRRTKWLQLFNS